MLQVANGMEYEWISCSAIDNKLYTTLLFSKDFPSCFSKIAKDSMLFIRFF